jgi:hypothetical protein
MLIAYEILISLTLGAISAVLAIASIREGRRSIKHINQLKKERENKKPTERPIEQPNKPIVGRRLHPTQ